MAKLEDYFSSARIAAAKENCKQFVGRRMKVQETKTMATEGEIVAAEPSYVTFTARRAYMVFKVDMLCGTNRVPRSFNMRKIVCR